MKSLIAALMLLLAAAVAVAESRSISQTELVRRAQ
jgi:hypothetical protein